MILRIPFWCSEMLHQVRMVTRARTTSRKGLHLLLAFFHLKEGMLLFCWQKATRRHHQNERTRLYKVQRCKLLQNVGRQRSMISSQQQSSSVASLSNSIIPKYRLDLSPVLVSPRLSVSVSLSVKL